MEKRLRGKHIILCNIEKTVEVWNRKNVATTSKLSIHLYCRVDRAMNIWVNPLEALEIRCHSVWICAFLFFFLVATFTFYLAASDDHEQRTPTGSEVNVTSSVTLDPPESPISETEAEDERGTLTASGVASDGLDRSWEPKTPAASDSVAVRYKDAQISRDGSEVQLPGDSRGARVGGPEPTAEYQTELFGIKSSQGPALHEATVTVTGTRVCFSERFSTVSQSRPRVSQTSRVTSMTLAWLYTNRTHRFHSHLSF